MNKLKILGTCIVILSIALILSKWLVNTAPNAESQRPQRQALLVEAQKTFVADEIVKIEVAGSVIPEKEIELRSPVNGEILWVSDQFISGGHINKGETILKIDTDDYEIAMENAKAALAQAQFQLELELGRQDIAKREWALLKADDASKQEEALALRAPHLNAAKAALASAKAQVKRAKLDLEDCNLKAPFNALVHSRYANIGTQATPQTLLARLAGTDTYHVEISIPIDRIQWVSFPGGSAQINSTSGANYSGKVLKLTGSLEDRGRMVRALIAVEDPWGKKTPNEKPLLLGEFVEVIIKGKSLKGVTRIPRKALRQNDSVWLDNQGKLEIIKVEVLFRESDTILVRDIPEGSILITSDIAAPISGRPLNSGFRQELVKAISNDSTK